DWSVEFFDNKIESLTGYSVDEFNSQKMKWIDIIVKEDIDNLKIEFIKAIKTGNFYEREYRIKTKAGDISWIEDRGQLVFDNKGEVKYISGVFFDITKLKLAEKMFEEWLERYLVLFKQSPDSIVIVDFETKALVDFNEMAHQKLGFTREEFQDLKIEDLEVVESRKEIDEHARKTMWEKGDTFETKLVGKNGEIYDFLMKIKKVSFTGKRYVLCIWHDITERKRLEEEILKKNEELESFVHTVSHDLKSPLISLNGFITALVDENKDRLTKNSKHIIERIIFNVNHMERLIVDLLELSQVGRIVGFPVEIKVKELFGKLALAYEKRLKEENIKLEITAKESCVIHADREQVGVVMDNLLSNAVKFMGNTEDRKIELICYKKGKSHMQICVKDNGIGIDPQYHEKIFQIFQRMDARNKTEGTGVGLAIVKKIIEDLGGRVWVESEVGKGAEFWIELLKHPEAKV
ncbi:MAG: ATP-binding protein, partial [Desulfobacterales bacterium]